MFTKEGKRKGEKLRKIVQDSSRLGEMPVFADSLDIRGMLKTKVSFSFCTKIEDCFNIMQFPSDCHKDVCTLPSRFPEYEDKQNEDTKDETTSKMKRQGELFIASELPGISGTG